MKKRTVMVLAVALSLSLFGCGNTEPKQEVVKEAEQETEQEDVKDDVGAEQEEVKEEKEQEEETNNTIAENDVLVITGEEDRYSEYDLKSFEEVSSFGEEKSFNEDAPIYSEEGTQVGYIKKGSTVKIDECLNFWWYRFKNPIEGTDYDELYVMSDTFSDFVDNSTTGEFTYTDYDDLRLYDNPIEQSTMPIDTEFEDVDEQNKILLTDVLIYDENGYNVGYLFSGTQPHVIKKGSVVFLVDTSEGQFYCEGSSFNYNSYNPSEETLYSEDELLNLLKDYLKENNIELVDSATGMEEVGAQPIDRKSSIAEASIKEFINILKYTKIEKIAISDVEVSDGYISFKYYK